MRLAGGGMKFGESATVHRNRTNGLRMLMIFLVLTIPEKLIGATDEMRGSQVYLIDYKMGESWQPGIPLADQTGFDQHSRYLRQLFDDDILIAEGRTGGDQMADGLLWLIRARSLDQAKSIADRNPATLKGVFVATVRSWHLGLSRVTDTPGSNIPTAASTLVDKTGFDRNGVERSGRSASNRKFRVRQPNKPFRIESLDPAAPIVLKAAEQ